MLWQIAVSFTFHVMQCKAHAQKLSRSPADGPQKLRRCNILTIEAPILFRILVEGDTARQRQRASVMAVGSFVAGALLGIIETQGLHALRR